MKAICLRGPAGVGKTTIAYELGRRIKEIYPDKGIVAYVSGDMFAHVSLDCDYSDSELDLKYTLIKQCVSVLIKGKYTIILDDSIQRKSDYLAIIELLLKGGYEVDLFSLTAPYKIASTRNEERFWKERVGEFRLKKLYNINNSIVIKGEQLIDTREDVESSCDSIIESVFTDK